MSIIISGMEMPKCCADCDLLYDFIGCSVTGTHVDWAKMDSEKLPNCPLKETCDNAPTVSDRYDEGYAQGYIDGSTGADWKGEGE